MRGGSRLYWRGVLATCAVMLLSGSLLGGSPMQGHAQTATAFLRSQTRMLPVAPPEDESAESSPGFRSAGQDQGSGFEGEPSNVQVSRTATGTLVDVISSGPGPNPTGVVVGKRLTDCVRVGASETTIVRNDDGIVAGYNDGIGFAGAPFHRGDCSIHQDGLSGYAFSTDEGRSWTVGGAPPVGDTIAFGPGTQGCSGSGRFVTRGDPWLDVHGDTFVYANLAQWDDNPELSTSPCFAAGALAVVTAGMSVHFGSFRDGGFAWNREVLVQSPDYPRDFLDKEAVAVDARGAIFLTTTNFIETCGVAANGAGQMELYRSLNGGATWDRRIIQQDETFAGTNCTDGIQNQGSAPAVGPHGELFVAWERGWFAPTLGGPPLGLPRATIAFKMSTDRGASFGPLHTIKSICSQIVPPAGYNRDQNNDFPRIAVARDGRHEGRIFVAFQDCSATYGDDTPFGLNTDVYLAHSDNNGVTWTIRPVHPTADGKYHFWPVVSVGKSGEVRVVYHEGRDVTPDPDRPTAIVCAVRDGGTLTNPHLRKSTKVSLVDVMEAVSHDGGQTFENQRLTTRTTNWCKATPINSIIPNFGDYIGGRGVGSGALTLWGDGRNGSHLDFVPTVFGSFGSGE